MKFTEKEKKYLRNFHQHLTTKELMKALNRNEASIKNKVGEGTLNNPPNWQRYSDAENNFIKENINKLYIAEIARALGRDSKAITNWVRKMGLESKFQRKLRLTRELEPQNKKYCEECNTIKPFEDFMKWRVVCKDCCSKQYLEEMRKKFALNDLDTILKMRIRSAKSHCNANGRKFLLTIQELRDQYHKQNGKCFYTGDVLVLNKGDKEGLSIDRVDSSGNYSKDNIVLSCWAVNQGKADSTQEEFKMMCGKVWTYPWDIMQSECIDYSI